MKRLIEYEKRDEISKGNVNYVNKNIKYTTKYQTKHLNTFKQEQKIMKDTYLMLTFIRMHA